MRAFLPLVAVVALIPATVPADPLRPSIRQQIDLGQAAAKEVQKEYKVLPESDPRVREVRRLGAQIVAQIPERERKDRPFVYSFDVIESKDLNAFALPGGPIYIYTGLLDQLKTEDAVIGILAHEVVHIRNQHWASAYADNTKRRLGIALILGAVNAGDVAFDVAGLADDLAFTLPYSRRHETEADRVGYDMMVAAGYNPAGLINVMEILKAASKGRGGPEWLSTHPDTDRRINALKDRLNKDRRRFPAQRDRNPNVLPKATEPPKPGGSGGSASRR